MKASTIALSKELQGIAKRLETDINEKAGERVAFSLLVFTEGRASYISNAPRAECVRELEKLLECWKQGMPDVPAHEVG